MKAQSNKPFSTEPQQWNEYQTVTHINQISFTRINEDGEEETVYEADMVIQGEVPTINQELKKLYSYALLTYSEYYILNEKLSKLRGWTLGNDTERVYSMMPQLAKVNIQYDEEGNETGYENLCVMPISAEIQELYPELMPVLHDSYIPSEDTITEIITEGMNTQEIDWNLQHYAATKSNPELIWMESEPRTHESDKAVEELIALGTVIVTIEP